MFSRTLSVLFVFVILLKSTVSHANTSLDYQQIADRLNLHLHKEWLALLHYRSDMFGNNSQSQADDSTFFITPNGNTNAKQELAASIDALFENEPKDEHISCQFPARTRWLTKKLQIADSELPPISCPKLQTFRDQLNAKRVTLVFAATYLNSPSSMFGHTFLRVDSSTAADANLLLSYTVSYAADVAERDTELMFAYRGIFGGYPGVTSVVPYYEKLKQYIDMENRDIWEFELNLTPSEIDQLIDHSWELMDKNFDYYFFDENCAYRLLALMDVGRPGTGLIEDISYQAIPSDTVRWVVSKELVEDVSYRPSTSSTVQSQLSQLSEQEKNAMLEIVNQSVGIDEALKAIKSSDSKARVLDASYEYARYDTVLSERTRQETAKLSHLLLIKRSQLGKKPPFEKPLVPAIRDDQGHETFRMSARAGEQYDRQYIELEARPAYHDLTDIPDGYPEGTHLRFLTTRLRYWTKETKLEAEELTLIDINSITPRNEFFKPTSWKIAVGAKRTDLSEDRPFATYLKGGSGMATNIANGLLYGYLQGSFESHRDIHKGYAVGPGVEFGWIRQKHFSQTIISLDYEHFIEGTELERYQLNVQQGFRLDKDQQVTSSIFRNKIGQSYNSEWRLEFRQYF